MSAKDDALVAVFVPALANLLAHAEKQKGAPLSEAEVVHIRDLGTCVMMKAGDAEKMAGPRGFRDVNPENCWVDWHRLRSQMTGGYLPNMVLCVAGGPDLEARCVPLVSAAGLKHELRGRDEHLAKAFDASRRGAAPSLSDDELHRIAEHAHVLYVLSGNYTADAAPAQARTMLRLASAMLESGAIAIKCESAGIAHGRERWMALAADVGRGGLEAWSALYRAFVQHPIESDHHAFSCGMHLLGQPDMIASVNALAAIQGPGAPAVEAGLFLFRSFGLYLLAECPPGTMVPGHTFRSVPDGPCFRLAWEPCTGYEEDDFFFNSFGRWRFEGA